jgi:Spy/CpxP family protein refolding chaperone
MEQASTTIGSLTSQSTTNHAKAEAAFYLILTPEQQTKLTQLQSQKHGHMRGGMGPQVSAE